MGAITTQHCLKILSIFIAGQVFCLLMIIVITYHPGRIILRACVEFRYHIRKKNKGILDYGKVETYLRRNGASFHFGKWLEPVGYMAIRLILGGIGIWIGMYFGMIYGALLAVIFFNLPNGMLLYLNHQDNEKLLPEIKLVYQALAIQIRAGVYVTDALAECYGSVQEERLRAALMELSGDIVMKSDIDEALDHFQSKFENRYVDSLCITILQALESGQAVELLADIAEQIKDMEVSVMSRRKSSLDRSITFYQLGVLTVILAVVLYACVTHMFSASIIF